MKPRLGRLVFAALLLLTASPGAGAEETLMSFSLGVPSRLVVEQAYDTVIIGDPLVVDIRATDDHSVVVRPLSPGITNLVFVDTQGVVTASIRI